jgi:hypothetical protein
LSGEHATKHLIISVDSFRHKKLAKQLPLGATISPIGASLRIMNTSQSPRYVLETLEDIDPETRNLIHINVNESVDFMNKGRNTCR